MRCLYKKGKSRNRRYALPVLKEPFADHIMFRAAALTTMRIWIDLGNSPHVPFFAGMSKELERRGHEIIWTARDYAQTVELAAGAGLDATVFGKHGGRRLVNKGAEFTA